MDGRTGTTSSLCHNFIVCVQRVHSNKETYHIQVTKETCWSYCKSWQHLYHMSVCFM